MSLAQARERLQIPETLRTQLDDFRRRVWTVKTLEALALAGLGVLFAFLAMFGLDRAWDTPAGPRLGLFVAAVAALALVPLALHRWVWRNRRPDQLARLLSRKMPRIGDQLLGVIELARDDSEQARSPRLVAAAIAQVAEDARKRDFRAAAPDSRHRLWAGLLLVPALATVALFALCPAAASNAWARLIAPWRDTPRYTFAALQPVPESLVVPHGEPFRFAVALAPGSAWHPVDADTRIGGRPPVVARLAGGRYEFDLPAQVADARLEVRVGDASRVVAIRPMLRPELTGVEAEVTLPAYLERPAAERKDVRGGSITLVRGSQARFTATAGRELSYASVDLKALAPAGATVRTPAFMADAPRDIAIRWEDRHGLAGKEPFTIKLSGRDDEAPTLAVDGLARQKVVLDTELLNFTIHARDDFGVRRVGLVWEGIDKKGFASPAAGDRVLMAGGPDREMLEVAAAFSARSFGIEPQPIALRAFVEDYLPGRPRVLSPPYTLFVLSAEQHAIWVTEQLSKWHRQSLEVRDREMQLHEANKQLRALSAEELDRPENRRKVEAQAQAERANGRRLTALVTNGEDLVKQAMRNPEFGVGHLERWAEMLAILKDISGNRMPSVADLLKQAADAPKVAQAGPKGNNAPSAGTNRAGGDGKPTEPAPGAPKPPTAVPSVVDRESTQQPPDQKETPPGPGSPPKTPRLTLAQTTLDGGKSAPPGEAPPAAAQVDEAIVQQRDLLAEFEKVSDELNKVLASLEGSTLVKRLKAASRVQGMVAGKLGERVPDSFGLPATRAGGPAMPILADLAEQEAKGSQVVSVIMDDLATYFERRRYARFKAVLDEMKQKDVIGSLRQLGDDLKAAQGLSMAQCEYWSDTLDRWADDLVDPANGGTCPGSKSRGSLPPSVVLEVLQILEAEVNLRDQTRVAEQARPALPAEEFSKQANGLSRDQDKLRYRVMKVADRIRELPDAEAEFGRELSLLAEVTLVMDDATNILGKPDTGAPAIAAETDAIELLLQSKRINPRGGGGGGPSPGGGGSGTTTDSALALIGTGINQKEVREDRGVSQATGDSGPALPEEFRSGLDQYFNKLERPPAGR
ncbi:hypothetical protein TA3x_001633 [Tundrisphaera sp. TA3]|uniref:hypothetical protein n=1 Tax=Tundrisphaera sp. TA3 TaxID=3435775 RepID=UPI003EB95189